MRTMIAPGAWSDEGPRTARSAHTPRGYQLSQSPLSTLESVENKEEAATATVGKRKVTETFGRKGYMYREVREGRQGRAADRPLTGPSRNLTACASGRSPIP